MMSAPARFGDEEGQAVKRQAGFKARRWVVERAHIRMNPFPRILTRCDKKAANCPAALHLILGVIMYVCAGLFGYALRLRRGRGRAAALPPEPGRQLAGLRGP